MSDGKQVRTNIDPALHEEMTRAARRLGLTKKEFLKQAILAKLDKFDVDFKCKTLRAEKNTLKVEKEKIETERNETRKQRDFFKTKHEEAEASVTKLEADLKAHDERGFLDRVFNRPIIP